MDGERDYELVGEDAGTDPAAYGVGEAIEVGDEPTEFGVPTGEIPEEKEE